MSSSSSSIWENVDMSLNIVLGRLSQHFKKYNDPEEARANPPHLLVGRDEDLRCLCDHYMSHAFQEQSRTNKATRQKQPYNHSRDQSRFYNDNTSSLSKEES
ncbi:CACTA en-spm transposon protein [Cucumis melo var. makuwa]|uniref:CACTA en-spm transposon protein n=1 Tax=Cucumis melo var. makuwa TaxID=1194695 RepID=A0A5A7SKX7_CUCMM|nr:CACTA en-spm transposon protein [Cucumis melo var. makuwa]TYK06448.1 CACTA en-spm transposon protein [Cucumis melo var. makuwa]